MSSISLPVSIRDAKPIEFDVLGELYALALADDDLFKVLSAKVDPKAMQEWMWKGGASDGVARGTDTVRILERTDTCEVMGVIWFSVASKNKHHKEESRGTKPEGFNDEELQKVMVQKHKWQAELLKTYGGFVFVEEFAIAPIYQSQGYGKLLLQHVIDSAKEKGLTVALTAAAGKQGFYEKCGFKKMGEPFMFGPNDSLEGPTPMLLQG